MAALALLSCASFPGRSAASELAFWFVSPTTTPSRPLRFAVVRQEGGRLLDPGVVEVIARPGIVEADPEGGGGSAIRVFLLVPPPSYVGPVVLEARSGDARVEEQIELTDASSTHLSLLADPPRLTKVPGASARVRVELPVGLGIDPVLVTNLGSLSDLEKIAPGRYEATFRPGEKRFPEVAILSAFLPVPDVGSPAFSLAQISLPLSAAIDLPGRTRPRVQMSVEIAGEVFGPVPSDARGHFEVPVVIPPGHGKARGVTIDRLGNRRVSPIDLHLPPTNRIAVTAHPSRLLADGRSRTQIVVTVIDAQGRPRAKERPVLEAERGRVTAPFAAGPGIYRAFYTAPSKLGDGFDRVRVRLRRDRASRAEVRLTLLADAPSRVTLSVEPGVVATPSKESASVTLALRDRFDNPVLDARSEGHARRGRLETLENGDPLARRYRPPADATGWEDAIEIQAAAPAGMRPIAAAIDPAGERLLLLDLGGRPVAGVPVSWEPGTPNPVAAAPEAERTARTDASGGVPLPASPTLAVRWPGRIEPFILHQARDGEGKLWVFPFHPGSLTARSRMLLMEPEPVRLRVDVRAPTGGRVEVRWSVNDSAGAREVLLQVEGGASVKQAGRAGRWSVQAAPGLLVSVTDLTTGVMSVMEVPAP